MNVRKAVITAAGKNQRTLPLQTLVDRDGTSKSVLTLLIEEALAAGIESIAVVIQPGAQAAYASAAGSHQGRLTFIEQPEPLGYGHAVACARPFVGDAPFLLLVGDHVYVTMSEFGCARQLVDIATRESCSVSAVQATHESKLPYYGVVGGLRVASESGLYQVTDVAEKPTPTEAEQRLLVPGLRSGHYLCYFGLHVLTSTVMDRLCELLAHPPTTAPIHLSTALARLARRERYLAYETVGRRYDLGGKYGLFTAQLALAMAGNDREEVLSQIVELMAQRAR